MDPITLVIVLMAIPAILIGRSNACLNSAVNRLMERHPDLRMVPHRAVQKWIDHHIHLKGREVWSSLDTVLEGMYQELHIPFEDLPPELMTEVVLREIERATAQALVEIQNRVQEAVRSHIEETLESSEPFNVNVSTWNQRM